MTTSELFTVGDIITTTEANPKDGLRNGENAEIIDIVMPADTEDGIGFYCIQNERVSGYDVDFQHAKRIFTVEEAKTAMVIPTKEQMVDFLGSAVLTEENGIDVNSTEKDDDHSLLIEGRTANGVRFIARLIVDYVEKADY